MAKRRLTERQKQRIAKIQQTRREKTEKKAQKQLQNTLSDPQTGLIISRHGRNVLVEDNNKKLHLCLFRQNIGDVTCGDNVIWQATEENKGVVTACLERKNALYRDNFSGEGKPLAANISQMLIVLAPKPEPSTYLLNQYLIAAENLDIQAIIIVNKMDLITDNETFYRPFSCYKKMGYPLLSISCQNGEGLADLKLKLQHHRSILVGQSGVGKSSLINQLLPDLSLQTGALSEISQLGRHTTTATTLYHLTDSGELIDSAGVRSFRLGKINKSQIEKGFKDLNQYLGHCKFNDCQHQSEPHCALLNALENQQVDPRRFEHFQRLLAENEANN